VEILELNIAISEIKIKDSLDGCNSRLAAADKSSWVLRHFYYKLSN
jgi:hypothetical protein